MTGKEELRASEAKYKTIFDSVNDAIFVHDPDTGVILDVSRKMTEAQTNRQIMSQYRLYGPCKELIPERMRDDANREMVGKRDLKSTSSRLFLALQSIRGVTG